MSRRFLQQFLLQVALRADGDPANVFKQAQNLNVNNDIDYDQDGDIDPTDLLNLLSAPGVFDKVWETGKTIKNAITGFLQSPAEIVGGVKTVADAAQTAASSAQTAANSAMQAAKLFSDVANVPLDAVSAVSAIGSVGATGASAISALGSLASLGTTTAGALTPFGALATITAGAIASMGTGAIIGGVTSGLSGGQFAMANDVYTKTELEVRLKRIEDALFGFAEPAPGYVGLVIDLAQYKLLLQSKLGTLTPIPEGQPAQPTLAEKIDTVNSTLYGTGVNDTTSIVSKVNKATLDLYGNGSGGDLQSVVGKLSNMNSTLYGTGPTDTTSLIYKVDALGTPPDVTGITEDLEEIKETIFGTEENQQSSMQNRVNALIEQLIGTTPETTATSVVNRVNTIQQLYSDQVEELKNARSDTTALARRVNNMEVVDFSPANATALTLLVSQTANDLNAPLTGVSYLVDELINWRTGTFAPWQIMMEQKADRIAGSGMVRVGDVPGSGTTALACAGIVSSATRTLVTSAGTSLITIQWPELPFSVIPILVCFNDQSPDPSSVANNDMESVWQHYGALTRSQTRFILTESTTQVMNIRIFVLLYRFDFTV